MSTENVWLAIEKAYVEEGLTPPQIAERFNVPRLELGQQVASGGWRKKREAWLTQQATERAAAQEQESRELQQAKKALGLDQHEVTADSLVSLGQSIANDLQNATDTAKIKMARSKAEAFRTVTEALNIATRLARDVRGIRLGAPSQPVEQETTRVEYEVVIKKPPEEKREQAS